MSAVAERPPSRAAYQVIGDEERASKRAVVLGPVAPVWSGADFCRPLADRLVARGYLVYVLDSLAPLETDAVCAARALDDIVSSIESVVGRADLLCGYALGGTLALVLAARLDGLRHVISLSGPGFPEAALEARLASIVAPIERGDLPAALARLSELVAPAGTVPEARHRDEASSPRAQEALDRMRRGFALLLSLDARPTLAGFEGRVLSLVGARSQLANVTNQAHATSEDGRRTLVRIEGAGMRLLQDAPEQTLSTIEEWIKDE